MQRPGHTGRKALATKKKALKTCKCPKTMKEMFCTREELLMPIWTSSVKKRMRCKSNTDNLLHQARGSPLRVALGGFEGKRGKL